ncbi:MAG: hypothetical protein ACXW4G_12630, partial [Candidatus Deferrimicrobiaceae bacterium]
MKKITTRPFLASLSILTLLATGAHAGPALYKGFPRGDALITVQELRQRIDAHDPKLVILAAQNDRAYRAGRIPGSRHSEWVLFKTKENPA